MNFAHIFLISVLPLHDHSETGNQVQLTAMCLDDIVKNLLVYIGLLKAYLLPTSCRCSSYTHGKPRPVMRIWIRRMRMFLGLPNPHPLVTSKNPAPILVPVPAPDPSFNHQAKIVRKTFIYTVL